MRIPLPGGPTLEGRLEGPADARASVVVCAPHPAFGGRMDTPLVAALAEAAIGAGLRTLRFHYRGIEGSEGKATGGLAEHDDVLAAHRLLAERHDAIAWVGYSFGGLMALRAIGAGGRPRALAALAFPTTIVGDDAARGAELEAALAVGVPVAFVAGADDPLCDAARLRAWSRGRAPVEVLPGEGHTFSSSGTRAVVARALDFVRERLG